MLYSKLQRLYDYDYHYSINGVLLTSVDSVRILVFFFFFFIPSRKRRWRIQADCLDKIALLFRSHQADSREWTCYFEPFRNNRWLSSIRLCLAQVFRLCGLTYRTLTMVMVRRFRHSILISCLLWSPRKPSFIPPKTSWPRIDSISLPENYNFYRSPLPPQITLHKRNISQMYES